MLDDSKIKMCTMLIQGHQITDIAKKIGVNRNTIYNWMEKDEVKAELSRRRQELINRGNQLILQDLNTYIANIKQLANDDTDKRVCLAANQYLINRIMGNTTSNVGEEENNTNAQSVEITSLQATINKFKVSNKT